MTDQPCETTTDEPPVVVLLSDEAATAALGAALAGALGAALAGTLDAAPAVSLVPGLRVYLRGQLGAGKTTLVRAMLAALGWKGRVKSPTFTLVELYPLSRLNLYHFDFYRFRDRAEWRDAGFSEYLDGGNLCFVEWPEMAGDELPAADLDIALDLVADADAHAGSGQQRRATLIPRSEAGRAWLKRAALST